MWAEGNFISLKSQVLNPFTKIIQLDTHVGG